MQKKPHDTFYFRARAVIIHDGKMLVVKHDPTFDYYALPGGHMDYGETPIGCLKREILEELGVEAVVGRMTHMQILESKTSGKVSIAPFYLVENGEDFANLEKIKKFQRSHDFEIAEMKWVDKDSFDNVLPNYIMKDFRSGEIFTNKEVKYSYDIGR